MSLNIYLEDPRQYYAENDMIKGRIVFNCPRDFQQLKNVTLTFSGCSKAKIRKVKGPAGPTGSYQSKCILFKRERILVPAEECKIPPTTYEWPFEFRFHPHVASPNAWPEAESFRVAKGIRKHRIPVKSADLQAHEGPVREKVAGI